MSNLIFQFGLPLQRAGRQSDPLVAGQVKQAEFMITYLHGCSCLFVCVSRQINGDNRIQTKKKYETVMIL